MFIFVLLGQLILLCLSIVTVWMSFIYGWGLVPQSWSAIFFFAIISVLIASLNLILGRWWDKNKY